MKSAFKLLSDRQKIFFFYVLGLILILALLEVTFFYLLQPLINYLVGDINNFSFNLKIFNNLDLDFKFFLFIFVLVFSLRTLISIILSFNKHKLAKSINDGMSIALFEKYLNQNYFFFLKHNSSHFVSKIITQVEKFSYSLIDSYISLLVESILVLSIIIFLLQSYFLETTVFFLVLSIFFLCFYYLIRKRLVIYGEKKILYEKNKVKTLQQSFYIIQNIKLDNLEKFFLKDFKKSTEISSNSHLYLSTTSELIKPLLEFFIMFVVGVIILFFFFYLNFPKQDIIGMLGIFIVAMFRILPSCNRILSSFNSIRYHKSIVSDIKNTFDLKVNFNSAIGMTNKLKFEKNIELRNISYSYVNGTKILNDISFIIKKNQSLGLFGDSGSGKSTLLNIISNLIEPNNGEIFMDGIKLEFPSNSFQKKIGYVPQKAYLLDDTIISNVILGKDPKEYDYEFFNHTIKMSNLSGVINNLEEKENTIIGERGIRLSGGQQQRLSIARALYKKPELIIFDEATSALDSKMESEVLETIFSLKEKVTTIIVSHDKALLSKCDEIYFINDGSLRKYK